MSDARAHPRRALPRARERDLRRGRVLAHHRAPLPARGARGGREPRGPYGAQADGRAGPVHLDGAGRASPSSGSPSVRIGEPLVSAVLRLPAARCRVRDLVRHPDVPVRRRSASSSRRRSPSRRRRCSRSRWPFRSTCSRACSRPSSGCCSTRRTPSCACCGIKPAPAGMIAFTREDIRQSVAAAEDVGEIQTAEEEMLYKVFDFAEKEASDVMVPRPDVVGLSIDLPPEEALRARARLAVHALPGVPRVARRHRRDPPRARARRGARGPGDRRRRARAAPPSGVRRPRDEGPRGAARRSSARRTSTWRSSSTSTGRRPGSSRSRTCSRRSSATSRTSSTSRTSPSSGSTRRRIRIDGTFTIDDFNEQFGTAIDHEDYHTVAGFVFGHLGRAADVGDEVVDDAPPVHRARDERLADPAARGRVPPRPGRGGRHAEAA